MSARPKARLSPRTDRDALALRQAREQNLLTENRAWKPDRHLSLWMHWVARWLRRPKRARIAALPSVAADQVAISFAGHSSVLVRYSALTIACDPMLGRRVGFARRESEPGLSPAELDDVGLVLISHGAPDHLHAKTLASLPRSATIVVPPRTAGAVSKFGFARVVELAVGQSFELSGVGIYACAARRDDGPCLSYAIRGPGPSVFFCGDSGYFSGFEEVGERHRPDIALLPIGGYAPRSFRARHMSPLDAVYAFEDLGARVMIPIHHSAFALSYEQLEDPLRWLELIVAERNLEPHVIPLAPGESRLFVPPRPQQAAIPNSEEITSAPVAADESAPPGEPSPPEEPKPPGEPKLAEDQAAAASEATEAEVERGLAAGLGPAGQPVAPADAGDTSAERAAQPEGTAAAQGAPEDREINITVESPEKRRARLAVLQAS